MEPLGQTHKQRAGQANSQPIHHRKEGGTMSVSITRISRIATPPKGSLQHSVPCSIACRRCGGMLVKDHCMDMDLGLTERGQWSTRCIQCGEMMDETILRNRSASRQTDQKIGLTAGREQPFTPPRKGKERRYAFLPYVAPTVPASMRPRGPLA